MSIGKDLRLRRIMDPKTSSTLMFAMSHGTSTPTVPEGIEDARKNLLEVREGGADCIFVTPGLLQTLSPLVAESRDLGIVAKITATASRGEAKHQERLIASVEHCAGLGVDGVVALVPLAPENEPDLIGLAAQIGEQCRRFGIPFIAEAEFPNAYYGDGDYVSDPAWGLTYLCRSARLCVELGADVVKTNWPGSGEQFHQIVDSVPVPVVVAGGTRESDLSLLKRIAEARDAGAAGASVGRNIFQHRDRTAVTHALVAVVRRELSPEDAVQKYLG